MKREGSTLDPSAPWPLDPYSYMNILIIQLLRLGDAVQIIPLVHGLKERFPQARIHVLASTIGKSIFDMEPLIEQIFVLRKELIAEQARRGRPADLTAALEMLQADLTPLFDIRWDWVINFSFSFPSALVSFLLNAKQVSGYTVNKQRQYFSKEKWFAHSLASFCHRRYSNFNWVDINKRIIDLPRVPSLPLLTVDPRMENLTRQHLQSIGFLNHTIIGVHPGASKNTKTWPIKNFAEFARIMIDQHDYRVLILGGKEEIRTGNHLQEVLGAKAHDLTGQTTLEQLKAYLKTCRWLVGNDTGPMHLAAALGTRTLALFFNSHFVETGVYAADHIALHPDLPCFPCRGPAKCVSKECLTQIQPQTLETVILSQSGPEKDLKKVFLNGDQAKAYISRFDPWGLLEWVPLTRESLSLQIFERVLLKIMWLSYNDLMGDDHQLKSKYLAEYLKHYDMDTVGSDWIRSLDKWKAPIRRFKQQLAAASQAVFAMQEELSKKNPTVTKINDLGRRLAQTENQLSQVDLQSCLGFVHELLAVFRENIEQGDLRRLAADTGVIYRNMECYVDSLLQGAEMLERLIHDIFQNFSSIDSSK